jgi:SAM-dependent methyltransferase
LSSVERLTYAEYWNSETEERTKPFWVLDGDFGRMERYLADNGFPAQLDECVRIAHERFGRVVGGVGCDLGAGSLWAVPRLLRLGTIERIYCVEYSKHRLLKLGPAVLEHYGVSPDSVVLALGDLHELRVPSATCDFVFLSAAFHHSDRPSELLKEIRRVLKPAGVVLILGEHITDAGLKQRVRHMAKFVVSRTLPARVQRRVIGRRLVVERFFPTESDLLVGDDRMGDHAYTREQYFEMFAAAGFRAECLRRSAWVFQAFVLAPSP